MREEQENFYFFWNCGGTAVPSLLEFFFFGGFGQAQAVPSFLVNGFKNIFASYLDKYLQN